MTFDEDEIEVLVLALSYTRNQANDSVGLSRIGTRCCEHVARKCQTLLDRIEQYKTDKENGDA